MSKQTTTKKLKKNSMKIKRHQDQAILKPQERKTFDQQVWQKLPLTMHEAHQRKVLLNALMRKPFTDYFIFYSKKIIASLLILLFGNVFLWFDLSLIETVSTTLRITPRMLWATNQQLILLHIISGIIFAMTLWWIGHLKWRDYQLPIIRYDNFKQAMIKKYQRLTTLKAQAEKQTKDATSHE